MKATQELIENFQHAEVLTDAEVECLLAYYNGVRTSLLPCPPEYKLLLNDVRAKADRLQDMKDAREESRARGKKWAHNYHTVVPRAGQQVDCHV